MNRRSFCFVQRDFPHGKDEVYDLCYIYKVFIRFRNKKNGQNNRLKYIIRAEKYKDVFAIKFYAARDRKSIYDKYSLAHNEISIGGVLQIFQYCMNVLMEMLSLYPGSSFVFKGAESYNPQTQLEESMIENQRFRIYRNYISKRVGTDLFHHSQYPSISIYLLTYKDNMDSLEKSYKQIEMLFNRFGLESRED